MRSPPSVSQQASALAALLDAYAKPLGGCARALAGMSHLWEEMNTVTEAPRILVVCGGEVSRGGFDKAYTQHRVDRQWTVVVMREHGWKNAVAEAAGANDKPFYDVLEEVRDLLRANSHLVSEELPVDYKGWEPIPNLAPSRVAGVFVDGAAVRFSTANDIPGVAFDSNA